MNFKKIILYIVSPTYFYADYKKRKLDERMRAMFIKRKNKEYFHFSLYTFIFFLIVDHIDYLIQIKIDNKNYIYPLLFLLFYYYFSRVNEIFISFLYDVLEKLNYEYKTSYLTFRERIKLAFHSYIELILNYSLIYWIIYISFGLFNKENLDLLNFLYYSGVTITTLGYGDIYATHSFLQLLSVYEIFNGMILVIVCFTIYVSLNYKDSIKHQIEQFKMNYIPNEKKVIEEYNHFKRKNKINLVVALTALLIIYIVGFYLISMSFPTNMIISFINYILFTLLIIAILNMKRII